MIFWFVLFLFFTVQIVVLVKGAMGQESLCSGSPQYCSAPDTQGVCPYSLGDFRLLCGQAPYWNATALCQARGWQLALVTDENQSAAAQTIAWCAVTSENRLAYIGAVNGLSREPCMVMGEGSVLVDQSLCGFEQSFYVLCQVPKQVSESLTVTTTRTIYTAPMLTTKTVTGCTKTVKVNPDDLVYDGIRRIKINNVVIDSQNPVIPEEKAMLKRPCSPVCSVDESRYLRVVQEPVPYTEAAEVCRKHGWKLADYTAGMEDQVAGLARKCLREEYQLFRDPTQFWIRSYNGVDGAACLVTRYQILGGGTGGAVVYGWTKRSCDFLGPYYPLCDIRCDPLVTHSGPLTGTLTTLTSVSTVTENTRVAIMTLTDTVTAHPVTTVTACP